MTRGNNGLTDDQLAEISSGAVDGVEPVSPEKCCRFVTDNYARYQGAWLCGKSAEILSYLLSMSGYRCEKVCTVINGVGHIYVRCGDLILDPTIKQFGDYPEISTERHPTEGITDS
ncbi:hypothetical protein LZS55_004466 [Salmonella enterica]|nr:hypothetical protein [Salmonella enterica]EGS2542594.1 hypothetical protein [Salmonella enterica]EIS1320531.1 hypothetical protein [Salmonella enterica]EIS4264256.1 hypothetical protein [Salmonella enterica]